MRGQATMRRGFFIMVFATPGFLGGCGGGSGSTTNSTPAPSSALTVQEVDCATVTPSAAVNILSFAFSPGSQPIAVGGIVKWTNSDPAAHTVTGGTSVAPDGKFDVFLAPAASKCLKFTAAGTFGYYCNIHTSMTGQVVVR